VHGELIAICGAAQYNQPTAVEGFANAHGSGQAGGRLWLHCLQVGGRSVAQDRGEPVAAKERMGTTIAGAEGDKMAKGDQGDEFLGALLALLGVVRSEDQPSGMLLLWRICDKAAPALLIAAGHTETRNTIVEIVVLRVVLRVWLLSRPELRAEEGPWISALWALQCLVADENRLRR
jgi:hypothetical protein